VGRSIEESSQVARELGYFASLKKHLLPVSKIKRRNPAELCLIIAGSYGQSGSSLERVSQDKHHLLEIGKGDTVIFSADPAPPQVLLDVNRMIDNLNRLGAMVYYYEIQDNLHVSGHGTAEDVKMLFAFIKPKYFVPIGGDYRHMYAYSLLVEQMGWPLERTLLLENGQKVEINQQKKITVSAS